MSKQIQHNLNIMMAEVMDILNARTSEVISAYAKKFGAAPDDLEYELWTWRVNNANATPDTFEVAETVEVIETAEVATAEVATAEVAETAQFIAEYVWTFTPMNDGRMLWGSERVR
jgi:hypothetical protein